MRFQICTRQSIKHTWLSIYLAGTLVLSVQNESAMVQIVHFTLLIPIQYWHTSAVLPHAVWAILFATKFALRDPHYIWEVPRWLVILAWVTTKVVIGLYQFRWKQTSLHRLINQRTQLLLGKKTHLVRLDLEFSDSKRCPPTISTKCISISRVRDCDTRTRNTSPSPFIAVRGHLNYVVFRTHRTAIKLWSTVLFRVGLTQNRSVGVTVPESQYRYE